jgi:heat shock protein HslJ
MVRTQAGSPAHTLLCTVAAAAGLLLLVGLPFAAAACGGTSGGSAATGSAADLEGKVWTATQIDGVDQVLADSAPTAKFADGRAAGSGGVNSYSGAYTASDDGTIKIEQPASTLMAGTPEADAQEQAFFAALTEAARFEVSGDALKLFGGDDTLLITFAVTQPTKLTGTTWNALAYNNGKGALQSLAADSEITAVFGEDGTLGGKASINSYSTTYTTGDGGSMTIDAKIAATQMAGPEDLMTQEQAYLAALPQTATYSIEGDQLWLRDADGAALAHYVAK